MGIPFRQIVRVGAYVVRQHLAGRKRYPLVLMLEPLFRCNLACAGCGKIDYPDAILNKRISVEDALASVDECGAPVVVMAGGEPLLHRDLAKIVEGVIARKKFAIVCTNALLLEKKIDQYKPSPYFTWSIHLDGDQEMHDKSVCEPGVYDRAVKALKTAKAKGFRVTINCTFFNDADPARVAAFFDTVTELGVDGITVSPGYAYERAPDQKHFLNRSATKQLFRSIFERGNQGRKWAFNQSTMFLDFLAGNQTYHCTPWGNPTRTVFGWQKPCYLLGEGYTKTFKELMDDTDWDAYGTGNYEKCADCMVHSGFEATAVRDTVTKPWKAARVALMGVKTEGPMAPDIPLGSQREAEYVFDKNVAQKLSEIRRSEAEEKARKKARSALAHGRRRCCRPRERVGAANWPGERISSPITARTLIPPSGAIAFNASGGKSRSAGSATARKIANGTRCFTANWPAIRLSMSTAAASVARRSSALAATVRTGASEAAKGSTKTRAPASTKALRKQCRNGLVGSDAALTRDDFRRRE